MLGGGELNAIIYADSLVEGPAHRGNRALLGAGYRDQVGKIIFAGRIARKSLQRRPEPRAIKAVDARIDLLDALLLLRGTFHLHNGPHAAMSVAHDPTKIGGLLCVRG